MTTKMSSGDRITLTDQDSKFDTITSRALMAYAQKGTRRGFLETMGRLLFGIAGAAAFSGLPLRRAYAKDTSPDAETVADVALTVQFPGEKTFTLAVPKVTHEHRVVGLVWVPGSNRRAAVKIAPQGDAGTGVIKVDFIGVDGDFATITSCSEVAAMTGVPLGSYNVSQGSPLHLRSVSRFTMPELSVLLIPAKEYHCCCSCGTLQCCPGGGHCIGCSGCGSCCKTQ
jgi:hypothetical protein